MEALLGRRTIRSEKLTPIRQNKREANITNSFSTTARRMPPMSLSGFEHPAKTKQVMRRRKTAICSPSLSYLVNIIRCRRRWWQAVRKCHGWSRHQGHEVLGEEWLCDHGIRSIGCLQWSGLFSHFGSSAICRREEEKLFKSEHVHMASLGSKDCVVRNVRPDILSHGIDQASEGYRIRWRKAIPKKYDRIRGLESIHREIPEIPQFLS